MDELYKILNLFEPITLEEMENVKLLDRIDTKFIFNQKNLAGFLTNLKDSYRVLDITCIRASRYKTLYYDTDNFAFYLQHHNGKPERYKVRTRMYLDSNQCFFEIKKKVKGARTVKYRSINADYNFEINENAKKLLFQKSKISPDTLLPRLWVYYTRITLVNKTSSERLTIDVNLKVENSEGMAFFPNLVIAEVKQQKSAFSTFINLMRANNIRAKGCSKYCLGIASIHHNLKKNKFKKLFLILNKQKNE